MSDAIPKAELFRALGYGASHDLLEHALEQAGLSRPAKPAISASKRAAVAALLEERFVAVCSRGDCRAEAQEHDDGRVAITAATAADCAFCGGSANARAVDDMVAALTRAGIRRLCVVGGSPGRRTILEALVGDRLELRLVDGTIARTRRQADADLAWADRVAIWGATQLDHDVSLLYSGKHVIQLARRGIGELAREVGLSVRLSPRARTADGRAPSSDRPP